MHPYIHNASQPNRPEHIHHYIQTEKVHSYRTRYSERKENYIPSLSKKQRDKMNPFAREYSRVWNTIPKPLRAIEDTNLFKRKLKSYLLDRQSGIHIPEELL